MHCSCLRLCVLVSPNVWVRQVKVFVYSVSLRRTSWELSFSVNRGLVFQQVQTQVTAPAPCGRGGGERVKSYVCLALFHVQLVTSLKYTKHDMYNISLQMFNKASKERLSYLLAAGSLEASGSTCGILCHSHHRTAAGPTWTTTVLNVQYLLYRKQ